MKYTIYHHDPMLTLIYRPETSAEYFGEDYSEEYGIEIPEELVNRVIESYENMLKIQDELDKFLREKGA